MRKTIKVADALATANSMLAAEKSTREGRLAVAYFISTILHATDTYSGFIYLGDYKVDDSRRVYSMKKGAR